MWLLYSVFKYWKLFMMLGMMGGLMWFMLVINHKDKKIAELEQAVQGHVFYVENLEDGIDLQNDMIEDLEKQNVDFEEKTIKSKNEMAQIRKETQELVRKLHEAKTGDTCEENMNWLIDATKDSAGSWLWLN